MTTEIKRDLQADLALCKLATPAPWTIDGENNVDGPDTGFGELRVATLGDTARAEQSDNAAFIKAAREGWPHAIYRALKAEAELAAEEDRRCAYEMDADSLAAENERLYSALQDVAYALTRPHDALHYIADVLAKNPVEVPADDN
ncbi:hypothetical protein [Paenibacillus polysaccharolyticus]|uniref:hypothetical protein n=1 Tax=Paenibacillus polysaccharolyticus TaxID=582692 RepID=UPI00300B035C